ncbi:helix-turn-helix domain-containing protein [Solirubrobacter sp. CPCC 204708]|uniref:Helix-turn-helix transcriptional regulator n=1 Tax=Solirubrobacter deserti TaxID=2282478 RepID=A0ABT4RIW3_9ACTN|nr:helix-turn-helix transcriptional regulator [Solirubrobacter deserti]MBE2320817.1 helix-turn-helix domain-containing protein [Solirubrobacter deserti]MDA0138452.1 helix-turn-helix transcriptional regulator [Solirubrobacter deserti]
MGQSRELSQFLAARRAAVTPADVGIPVHGRRQVAGLRREEVASLAGVSVEYYKRLERGQATSPSDSVLGALADALRLNATERSHLFDLARAAGPACPTPRAEPAALRPIAQRVLDTIQAAAVVINARGDYIGANALGRALFEPLFDSPEGANSARFLFLDPAARTFWVDWEQIAKATVGSLRSYAGANPCDPALTSLVGELSTRSEAFRTWWAAHTVHAHQAGVKRVRHPLVGEVTVNYEMLTFAADDVPMAVYTPEPGSASEAALNLLGSWIATPAAV